MKMMPPHVRILKRTPAVPIHDTSVFLLGNELVERNAWFHANVIINRMHNSVVNLVLREKLSFDVVSAHLAVVRRKRQRRLQI